jgi:flagellar biosynthesis protein FliQ
MTEAYVITLIQGALTIALIMAGPALLASLLIGSLISIVQAATQINEITLTLIPKMLGVGLVVAVLGSWMVQNLLAYTANLIMSLSTLPR